jgi:site-specific DNA recombinase
VKKAALYIRVSTDHQKEEGYSIEFQEEKLRAYCKATDMTVGDLFIDPAYSGSNINRPALQSLIERINEFDAVIVYKLDRLSRSQKDTLYLIEDIFIPNNVAFISLSESFDTSTPFGRAMVGILSVFAQLERENIKERMISGRVQRAKEGLHNGQSNCPIGYRYIDGKLVVDEYEKRQILEVCELYLKGYGASSIIEEMKARGYKTKYGFWKNRSTVNAILFNPVYRGKVTFEGKEYEGQHERIISDELYIKLLEQKALRKNGSAFKRTHLLSGLLWCEHCGGRVAAKNIHNKHYYACYSASKSSRHMIKDPNCPLPTFVMGKLEEDVIERVMDIYKNTDKYIEMHKQQHIQPDTSIYEKRISELEKQKRRLLDLYQFGEISAEDIRRRIDEVQTEIEGLKKTMNSVIHYDYEGFADAVQALGTDWNDLSTDEKREYMLDIIEKIYINSCGEIKIVVKIKCGDKI